MEWETLPPFGESVLSMRFIAISPRGMIQKWPSSRWRRLWMRFRGWTFVRDSLVEMQRARNKRFATITEIWADPHWEMRVQWMSREEIEKKYGPSV